MNNKTLYIIIVILLVVIIGGVYLFFSKQGTTSPASNETPAPSSSGQLSENPDQAKYAEYLSEFYLGRMAIGKKIGTDGFPTKTSIFTRGTDQFCTMMTLKKTIPSGGAAIAIYDTIAQTDNQSKMAFPMELKVGGSGGCSDLIQPAGKYEFKFYIDDVLAAVLPFEVR